jgi:hypothetical protein
VGFLKNEDGQDWSISLVLDLDSASFTAVVGRLSAPDTSREGLYSRALAGK